MELDVRCNDSEQHWMLHSHKRACRDFGRFRNRKREPFQFPDMVSLHVARSSHPHSLHPQWYQSPDFQGPPWLADCHRMRLPGNVTKIVSVAYCHQMSTWISFMHLPVLSSVFPDSIQPGLIQRSGSLGVKATCPRSVIHTYIHTDRQTYRQTDIHAITCHYMPLHAITCHYITLHYIT